MTSDLWPPAAREAQVVAVHAADTNPGTLSAGPETGMSQRAVGSSNCLTTATSRNIASAALPGPVSEEFPLDSTPHQQFSQALGDG